MAMKPNRATRFNADASDVVEGDDGLVRNDLG